MIGREFIKRLRLLYGRSETIKTRYELDKAGRLVEHIVVETHDPPAPGTTGLPPMRRPKPNET
jgi:hypothetical protein